MAFFIYLKQQPIFQSIENWTVQFNRYVLVPCVWMVISYTKHSYLPFIAYHCTCRWRDSLKNNRTILLSGSLVLCYITHIWQFHLILYFLLFVLVERLAFWWMTKSISNKNQVFRKRGRRTIHVWTIILIEEKVAN